MKLTIIVFLGILAALFMGLATALTGSFALFVLLPLSIAVLVIYNYRIAVVLLAFMIPLTGSVLVPMPKGLNPFTYAIAAGIFGLFFRRFSSPGKMVWPPRIVIICLFLPLVVGVLLGLPHLSEGARNLAKIHPEMKLDAFLYFKQYFYKPVIILIFSILLANAVVDSKKPQRYVLLFALSAAAVVLYVMIFTLSSGVTWGAHRAVINQAGMHYNLYGKLFALAFGPMLYVAFAERGFSRMFFGLIALLILVGTIFNFARAGMLAVIVTLLVFLWQRKNFGVTVLIGALMLVLVMLAPEEWRARMLQGSTEVSGSYSDERFGALTSGRLISWLYLVPDIIKSPLIGRGTGSTLWNSAVTDGLYDSVHPHNMYLQILMDLGIVGLIVMIYFYFRVLRAMHRLSENTKIEPRLRAFFAGSRASLIGMLVLAFTGGDWFPMEEQGPFWVSMGILFAYWHRESEDVAVGKAASRRNGFYNWQFSASHEKSTL